ncbi:D(3) dopamine receptor-like [Dreissena polymorpha]|nr:D(3) dopamine receptor-like [Dreissena polymorpha]
MIPTIVGNGLIIISIIKYRKLRSNMHVLVLNLAVSDLIVGAVLIPVDLFGDFFKVKSDKNYCLATVALFITSLGSSCYNLLLISIERYIAIVYPLRARLMLTKSKMALMIAIGWVLTILDGLLPIFGLNTFSNSTANASACLSTEVWNKGYRVSNDWQLLVALIANVTLYSIVVFVAVRKASGKSRIGDAIQGRSRTTKEMYQLITMVIVLGTFILCWLPYNVMIIFVTLWDCEYYQFIKRCPLIPGVLNSGLNWIIYGYRNADIRTAFKHVIMCKKTIRNSYHASVS